MRIFLDAGHSGSIEPGACYFNLRECDVALKIALRTGRALIERGIDATHYRAGDITSTSLTERARNANEWRADFLAENDGKWLKDIREYLRTAK